jgi:hypothetical protein
MPHRRLPRLRTWWNLDNWTKTADLFIKLGLPLLVILLYNFFVRSPDLTIQTDIYAQIDSAKAQEQVAASSGAQSGLELSRIIAEYNRAMRGESLTSYLVRSTLEYDDYSCHLEAAATSDELAGLRNAAPTDKYNALIAALDLPAGTENPPPIGLTDAILVTDSEVSASELLPYREALDVSRYYLVAVHLSNNGGGTASNIRIEHEDDDFGQFVLDAVSVEDEIEEVRTLRSGEDGVVATFALTGSPPCLQRGEIDETFDQFDLSYDEEGQEVSSWVTIPLALILALIFLSAVVVSIAKTDPDSPSHDRASSENG